MLRHLLIGACGLAVLFSAGCAANNAKTDAHQSAAEPKSAHYGGEMKLKAADTVPVGKIAADPKKYEGKWVRVSGVVTDVCKTKGCWMKIADKQGADAVFVKFTCPIDGRLIPLDAPGKKSIVEGTVKIEVLSEKEARHYAEDGGASPAEIEKIKGEQTRLRLWDAAATIEDAK